MKKGDVVICPNCGGKGHVLDGAAVFCLTIFSLILVPAERNDPTGVTRTKCLKCDGEGHITL